MLRITVDLVPWGAEGLAETLTEVIVGNDCTGTRDLGNYDIYETRGGDRVSVGRIEKFVRLGHNRGRDILAAEALRLVAEVNDETLYDEEAQVA